MRHDADHLRNVQALAGAQGSFGMERIPVLQFIFANIETLRNLAQGISLADRICAGDHLFGRLRMGCSGNGPRFGGQ